MTAQDPPARRPRARGPRRPQLDDPTRAAVVQARIRGKGFLRALYAEVYARYQRCLARCPPEGAAVELGAGLGFAATVIPGLITTDILPYPGLRCVLDARALPFRSGGLRAILMLDVFHHVPDVEALLREAERCLRPGGRVLIVDQHPGWLAAPIYRFLHYEPFDANAAEWRFESAGPLSDGNGALAWIVFRRDRARFERLFPGLRLERYEPHTPLRYWLAGGLRRGGLPGALFPLASRVDGWLLRLTRELGSFVDVELVRTER